MDPAAGNLLFTALNALGIVFGVLAIAGSGLTWSLSRASRIRAFEEAVFAQLTTANTRLELCEKGIQAHKLEVTNLCDEMLDAAERAGKARRRIAAENSRAERRETEVSEDPEPQDREAAKRGVRKLLGVAS